MYVCMYVCICIYIPIDLHIPRPQGLRGLGVLGSLGSRTFVARLAVRLASSPALINFSHSFRSVPLEQNRPVAILGPPDGLGVDFGSRKPCYFEIRRPSHPFGTFFVQEQQNTVKRGTRSTSEILHDETKTTKIRSERRLDNARCHGRVRTAAKVVPRVSREPPGRSLDVSGTVLEPPAGSQNGSEAAFSRSGAVPEYLGPLPNGP